MVTLKYYSVSLSIYLLEVLLVFLFDKVFQEEIIYLNFIVRIASCVLAAYIFKKYLFTDAKGFYKKFLIIASITPAFSTFLLVLLIQLINLDLIYLKVASDVVSSVLAFFILRVTLKN